MQEHIWWQLLLKSTSCLAPAKQQQHSFITQRPRSYTELCLLHPAHLGAFVWRDVAALLQQLWTRDHCFGNYSVCRKQKKVGMEFEGDIRVTLIAYKENKTIILFQFALAKALSSHLHWFLPPRPQSGTIQHLSML